MASVQEFGWPWFRNEMLKCEIATERSCLPLLELIGKCDAIVGAILHRQMSWASPRPQDYVVAVLTTRAFRLCVSSIKLALSGYVDATPNLDRTVFEIAIRLLDMGSDPVAASLGYLMQGVEEEIGTIRVELDYRRQQSLDAGNLDANLRATESHLADLRKAAADHGFNPDNIRNKHGKLNVREVCKRHDIEKAYLVNFAYDSSHVHEKNVATAHFYSGTKEGHTFNMGPIPAAVPHAIADSLTGLVQALDFASQIVGDHAAVSQSRQLLEELMARVDHVCDTDRKPSTGQEG